MLKQIIHCERFSPLNLSQWIIGFGIFRQQLKKKQSLKKLSEEGDFCNHCVEQRLVTRIMSEINSIEVKQKLLEITLVSILEPKNCCLNMPKPIIHCERFSGLNLSQLIIGFGIFRQQFLGSRME